MSKFERWLPFKFRRDKAAKSETPAAAASSLTRPAAAGHPAALQPAQLMTTPFGQLFETMFNDPFFREPFARFGELDRWFGDFSPARFQPMLDVVDEEGALRVSVELPGMSKDDVKLQLDNDVLVIRGEKRNTEETKENGLYRSERFYGAFQRAIPLPAEIDQDNATANFADGVLTVRFPKRAQDAAERRSIAIK